MKKSYFLLAMLASTLLVGAQAKNVIKDDLSFLIPHLVNNQTVVRYDEVNRLRISLSVEAEKDTAITVTQYSYDLNGNRSAVKTLLLSKKNGIWSSDKTFSRQDIITIKRMLAKK